MEEPPDRRGPSLLTYVLVTAFVLAVVIGVLILYGPAINPCNTATCAGMGEGSCLSSPCVHIQNAL